jgi:glucokinase
METVLAVDLGGTHMRAAAVRPEGAIVDRVDGLTPHDDPHPDQFFAIIGKMCGRHEITRAVVGLPGRVDYREGKLEWAPNLPATWPGDLTVARLGRLTGVPTAIANDADLAAAGEAYFGAGRGYRDVVFMTVSTGIGAGVVLGGRLVAGRRSGVEIGHVVIDREAARAGRPATVEELGAGPALARAAAAAGVTERNAALVALAESGEPRLADAWAQVTQAVGLGAATLAQMFCPEVIVIGGGLGEASKDVRTAAEAAVSAHGPRGLPSPITVVPALLGRDAGLQGAAAWQRAAG